MTQPHNEETYGFDDEDFIDDAIDEIDDWEGDEWEDDEDWDLDDVDDDKFDSNF
jgi:hypothetical protein